ncbi:hypothetical protein QN277_028016 [Acacia crassicarpa]|uniref:Zinc finger PHD-type domain-containing protein n=1 Tax=Acacia crassicarpa TaxID=499986 RepID=A0AAE1JZZ3_9FABA|nr:hypothetical protein QN277_028016 [Acacia crassicarpa]
MEKEARVCDICGDVGLEEKLAICSKCTDGAEHIYCMRILLDKVPEGGWTCEDCAFRTYAKKPEQDKVKETTGKSIGHPQCQGFGSSVNIESRSGSKIKIRSSWSGGKGISDVTSLLPAKRHGALSQAQSVEKTKTIRVRFVPPRSPNMNKSLLQKDTSFNLKKGQMKAYKQTNSKPQISCNALEKAEVPPDYICIGTFQLYSSEGLESSCDGIQAHLSTFASPKVLEAVDKLPEIIMLEQLPRLRTWPSQFVECQAVEDHVALYFFATDLDSYRTHYSRLLECMTKNDLALRGSFDGDELLIFPPNLLSEQNQRQNSLLFLWGVFRGQKVGSSVPLPNSLKEEDRSSEKTLSLDPNACPQAGEDTGGVDEAGKCLSVNNSPGEIHTFESPGAKSSSVDAIILGGYSYSSDTTEVMQANDEGEVTSLEVDHDLSLHDGVAVGLSDGVGNHGNNEKAHEDPAREDDVEVSLSGSNEQNSEIEEGMDNELTLERQAAEALILFSKGFGKI